MIKYFKLNTKAKKMRRALYKRAGQVLFTLILLTAGGGINAQDIYKIPVVYSVPGMDNVKEYKDITYKSDETADKEEEVGMDIYTPNGLSESEQRPAVIFVHGGYLPRSMVVKPKDWGIYTSYGKLMAASGLVGITFNYRYYGWDKQNLETALSDVSDAIAFVRKHAAEYNIDPDRICLWGFSGGGPLLSIPFKEKMKYVRCIVAYYMTFDISGEVGGIPNMVDLETAKALSPGFYLNEDTDAPPVLIARAGMDGLNLNKTISNFITRALELNEHVEVLSHPNGRHGFDALDNDPRSKEIIARTIDFIKAHLGKNNGSKKETTSLPSAAKIYLQLAKGNIAKSKMMLKKIAKSGHEIHTNESPYNRVISESGLNRNGYRFMALKQFDEAVEVFKWVVELYPDSPNAYDSLAEAYEAVGNNKAALASAQRILDILKKSTGLDQQQKNRYRKMADEKIKRLSGSK